MSEVKSSKVMTVGIGLGSNYGGRLANIRYGMQWLNNISVKPIRTSLIYETLPVDCPPGSASFLNAVCEIGYVGELVDLLVKMHKIEQERGREAVRPKNAPRPLDLDILYVDNIILRSPNLTIPHPKMTGRRFVLQPLADIRADLILPTETRTIREILNDLPDGGDVRLFEKV